MYIYTCTPEAIHPLDWSNLGKDLYFHEINHATMIPIDQSNGVITQYMSACRLHTII